jgi:hypothetical protein
MMKLRRIVYPLFFVLVLAFVLIPSTPNVHADTPVLHASVQNASLCDMSNCSSPNLAVASGDFVLVHTFCMVGGNPASITDTFGDTYVLIGGFAFGREEVWGGIAVAGNVIQVTAVGGSCSFSSSPGGAFSAESFTGVASFGNLNGNNPGCSGACTDSVSLNTKVNNAIVYEAFAVYGGGLGSCPTITNQSAQTTTQTLLCLNGLAGAYSIGRTVYSSGQGIGTHTYSMQTSASAQTTHVVVELDPAGGTPSVLGQQTACYGNCGNPAITLANTNSTHTINFNNSVTLFYEFQSNLKGFILNETVNIARTYANGMQVGLGIYTASCPAGTTPFTSACVGQQRANTVSNPNIAKGKFTFIPSPISVSLGQWVGIAVTAFQAGLDLNDTNTNVAMFQQSPGTIPPLINNGVSFSSCSCKIGMWTYITGNTVGIPIPPITAQGCGGDIVCFMTASACALTPSNCLIGALAFGILYSFISIIALEIVSAKVGSGMTIPGGVYILTFMGWMTFWSLIVGAIWFVILEILAVIVIFSGFFGALASGGFRHTGRGGRDA